HGDGVLDGALARAPSRPREGPRPAHARRRDGRGRRHHHLPREAHPQEVHRRGPRVRRDRDRVRHGLPLDRGFVRAALAAAALLAVGVAHAADGEARWYVRIDNDVAFETDRWYSSGVRIARVRQGWELALEQDVYTPEGKRRDIVDRSPAARLVASLARHYEGEGSLLTLEADAGVRGPSAGGKQATAAIHHIVHAPFVDWSRQLPDRFDGSLTFARTQALGALALRAHFGATVGTQLTFAHAGIEARIGDPRAPSSA